MIENSTPAAIGDALRNHQRFLILSHLRPDGDALGCQIALALCLRELGKDVTVWNHDGMLEKYAFLPHSELVLTPPSDPRDFEVVIALDTAVQNRVGRCLDAVASAGLWINIDHHISNDRYGDLNYIDSSAPATGQILYELIRDQELPLTYAMADNLFIAISTDTGSFQYPATTARSFEIGAELIRAGANVGELSRQAYDSFPRRRIELMRSLLNVLKFSSGDRVASFALPAAEAARLGALPEDNEGLIDTIRAVEGVIAAVFFEELEDGFVRVSMRSKDPRKVDACRVCQQFGGGGHTLAAGARLAGPFAAAQEKVLAALDDELSR